jgi:predicted O-linked N-acetylglucosamine transferase (SPINDLY family)
VDLLGHTGGNRLPLFARRLAPIQVLHFGYQATTGLTTIDYRLTDRYSDPPGMTERFHTERLFRLPELLWCYPPPASPEVGPLPARRAGAVTFGSFNGLAKVTDQVIAVWAQILTRLPDSRMVILAGAGRAADERILDAFALNGVPSRRVSLLGKARREVYFQLFGQADIALDPFPCVGCNTTADALWMGLPVVSLAGPTCFSRQGVGLLSSVGLTDLLAKDPEAYVETAVRLAGNLERLAELRAGLRQRMRQSPLTDVPGFTRDLEEAYRTMWQTWCAGLLPAGE